MNRVAIISSLPSAGGRLSNVDSTSSAITIAVRLHPVVRRSYKTSLYLIIGCRRLLIAAVILAGIAFALSTQSVQSFATEDVEYFLLKHASDRLLYYYGSHILDCMGVAMITAAAVSIILFAASLRRCHHLLKIAQCPYCGHLCDPGRDDIAMCVECGRNICPRGER